MSKLGTTYLFRVKVEKDSVDITKGLNFDVSFYVFPGRRLNLSKEEMARMDNEDGAGYYAVVESTKLGIGPVCADVTIYQEVSSERIGVRPIVVPVRTGVVIGRESNSCHHPYYPVCDHGYTVSVVPVNDVPVSSKVFVHAGVLTANITSFDQLTPDLLDGATLQQLPANNYGGRMSLGVVAPGDKVLVLIPSGMDLRAQKDDGLGGKDAFDETILGANGQVHVEWNGTKYDVYGELITATGELFYYVD